MWRHSVGPLWSGCCDIVDRSAAAWHAQARLLIAVNFSANWSLAMPCACAGLGWGLDLASPSANVPSFEVNLNCRQSDSQSLVLLSQWQRMSGNTYEAYLGVPQKPRVSSMCTNSAFPNRLSMAHCLCLQKSLTRVRQTCSMASRHASNSAVMTVLSTCMTAKHTVTPGAGDSRPIVIHATRRTSACHWRMAS